MKISPACLRTCLEPELRIDGLAPFAYFKIELRLGPLGIAQGGDHIAGLDLVADRLVEHLGMTIQSHIAPAVTDDDQQSHALQPIGIYYSAAESRPHLRAAFRFDH